MSKQMHPPPTISEMAKLYHMMKCAIIRQVYISMMISLKEITNIRFERLLGPISPHIYDQKIQLAL
jgi:hypothetical protein